MLLNVVQVNSSLFDHYSKEKRLVAEISSTGIKRFDRLYDDAVDVGFSVFNQKTRSVTRWAFHEHIRDEEHEIVAWHFVPTPETLRVHPNTEGYKIVLLND